ncbi:F-box protein SKIP23-like isoform X2 [Cucurbita maxima]|uniref:F-box protein SKIP23-like isoform X2 n=1 Tax=Cucurbita maxima TaxID=3661 RepID=A0A6J1ID46_CUCMA|nr:F-box protein SKIP23-like isoform X2 [Cucurbita maxima]
MADWTQLPPDLLQVISDNLNVYSDYLRFRVVCQSWRSSVPKIPRRLPPQLPWLIIPLYHDSRCGLFNFSDNKIHFLHLPEASLGRRRCGSSHGWLVILDETPTILLLNPLTRAKCRLPPLSTFPNVVSFDYSRIGREYLIRTPTGHIYSRNLRQMRDTFVKKIVLSSSPSNQNDFSAVAILNHSGDLAFCRSGGESWTFVDDAPSDCEDIVYSDGLFYAVDKHGVISVMDLRGSRSEVSLVTTGSQSAGDIQYLVKLGRELLLVSRYLDIINDAMVDELISVIYRTVRFEVFRMEWEGPRWEKVENLDEMALFVGGNSSMAFSASDFGGISGNCIYYTDDYSDNDYQGQGEEPDMGIFRLCDGSFEQLPYYSGGSHSRRRLLPPIWVTPNPC